MAESSYTDSKLIEMSRNFVNVVAHSETGHGDKEVQVGKEKMTLCKEYFTIPCEVHTKAWSAVSKFFQGNFGTPTTVFCDPSGKELFRQAGGMGAGELTNKMKDALGKVGGEKVPFPVWAQAKKNLADGNALLEKGEHKKAIEAYSKVGKLKGKGFKAMCDEALAKVNEAGDKLLADALALDNVDEKKKALKKIADDFKPLEVAAKAKKELEGLK